MRSAPKHSDRHRAALKRQVDRQRDRGQSEKWRNSSRWKKSRKMFMKDNPLCARCAEANEDKDATVLDHIIPHREDYNLFWDQDNWQALCVPCHNHKTGKGQ